MASLDSGRRSLLAGAVLCLAVAVVLAIGVIPLVSADVYPAATPERAVPVLWMVAGFNLIAAAALASKARRSKGRSHDTTIELVFFAILALIVGFMLADGALAYSEHGPAMHNVPILMFGCIAAEMIAAGLAATTAFRLTGTADSRAAAR